MATYYSNGKAVDGSTLWGDPVLGGKINSLTGYKLGADKVDMNELRKWFDNSAYAYQNPNENQRYSPYQYNDWDTGLSFMPIVGDGRGNNGLIGFHAFEGADAAYADNLALLNGRPVWAYDAQGNLVNQGTMTGYEQSGPYSNFNKSLAVAIGGPMVGAGLQALGAAGAAGTGAAEGAAAGGAAAGGAAPSITGLGMTGTVPAGMGYGSAATGSLAGYGGLGAGAGYGATFGGSMEALGAAGAAGAAGGGAGGAGWGEGVSSLPGHEVTHAGGGMGDILNGMSSGGAFDWTKLIGPATSLIGGAISANATSNAAEAQLQAAREAQALNEPFRQFGIKAGNRLMDYMGTSGNTGAEGFNLLNKDFTAADFQADPGYQFRLDQGQKALERARSSAGLLGSGKYLKDAMNYNQGQASQEFGNSYNRFQVNRTNRVNPLLSVMGAGQTAANTVGEFATQAGNAQAAGKIGTANAIGNALTQGYGMYQNAKQTDQNNALMNMLLSRQGGY